MIEHIPYDDQIFAELRRVLRPGGLLILGTPDYDTVGWRTIEPLYGFFAPGGYKDEHITHYTRESLIQLCREWGFALEDTAYVFRSELGFGAAPRRRSDRVDPADVRLHATNPTSSPSTRRARSIAPTPR